MTGGLIQLITTGIQDSPIIGNPEITFFKKVLLKILPLHSTSTTHLLYVIGKI